MKAAARMVIIAAQCRGSMKTAARQEADFLVIGCGIAGLRAAIELAAAGRVLVITKAELTESATQYAQGGIAAALSVSW